MMFTKPLILSFELALISTICLFFISLPIAYWLSKSKWRIKPFFEALIAMPIVLPPTVIGFYFLVAFSPNNFLGHFLLHYFNLKLVFSFTGLVLGSIIYSFPFMVQPIQSGFESLSPQLKEAAHTLGASKVRTFFRVLLPNIKRQVLTGIVLCFAHTLGEFGVVLMIGGNIPNKTRVASVAIYDEVNAMHYANANEYALILFVFTFIILLLVYTFNGKYLKYFYRGE